jgi:hypothetical protein
MYLCCTLDVIMLIIINEKLKKKIVPELIRLYH